MCEVMIFGGTSEGRILAQKCVELGISAYVSCATEYGSGLIRGPKHLHLLTGRMDSGEMESFMRRNHIRTVVDATHPYAAEVTANIRSACQVTGVGYIRVVREENEDIEGAEYFDSVADIAAYLSGERGNILITTGSKELSGFCGIKDFRERCFARVLPSETIVKQCRALGLGEGHIIAEKGPFTLEQNEQQLRETNARFLVTKDSGNAGGFMEKVRAARNCGAKLLIIRRPQESGISLRKAIEILSERFHG